MIEQGGYIPTEGYLAEVFQHSDHRSLTEQCGPGCDVILTDYVLKKRGFRVPITFEAFINDTVPLIGGPIVKRHLVETPRSAEWIARRDAFIEQWNAALDAGYIADYGEEGYDLNCSDIEQTWEDDE